MTIFGLNRVFNRITMANSLLKMPIFGAIFRPKIASFTGILNQKCILDTNSKLFRVKIFGQKYSNRKKQSGNKNKAPFGSLSERKTLEYAEFQGVLGPGSGYYKVPSQFEHISGGKIPFQNGPRLVDPRPVDDNPPPGAYFKMPDWSSAALSKKVPKVRSPL